MPITLQPITRRQFLVRSLAALAGTIIAPKLFGSTTSIDPHRFALLADTHIPFDRTTVYHDTNMADNLKCVADELAALDPRPASAFIVGDLAYRTGESGDYAALVGLLDKVREAGQPIHLTLGNHDERQRFWRAIPPTGGEDKVVENRNVALVKAPRANFFIMDSLEETNKVPGLCGEAQLKWLANALDAHADKPAITMIHHQPDVRKDVAGLIDTKAFMDVILPRKHVKAHFFGHTHDWKIAVNDGLHLVNLPPVSYVFTNGRPSGWVDLQLENDRAQLELHAIDPNHPDAGRRITLKWR